MPDGRIFDESKVDLGTVTFLSTSVSGRVVGGGITRAAVTPFKRTTVHLNLGSTFGRLPRRV